MTVLPITVLLVEDNRTDVFVITEVLKRLGLEAQLHVASDGESALEFWNNMEATLHTPCPALVLLDLNLPKFSGMDLLRRIRNARRCPNVPVVIVTSSSSTEDMALARALNASAYLRKPADLSEYMGLEQVVRQVLTGLKSRPPNSGQGNT